MGTTGLSPRLRGNLIMLRASSRVAGSIPAPAGEPCRYATGCAPARVYPRACGGTAPIVPPGCDIEGLSPRLRGNQVGYIRRVGRPGSIPAPAGEPPAISPPPTIGTVYPRACGGTRSSRRAPMSTAGLSPRLRGNPVPFAPSVPATRSIPAPAGEPALPVSTCILCRVYPRACGGTSGVPFMAARHAGLSPRLRGNHVLVVEQSGAVGSIPAPAGEPTPAATRTSTAAVYPRACGGTSSPIVATLKTAGLSPRLRGNQLLRRRADGRGRSIPAPAGEPGATMTMTMTPQRSIPAPAGEPWPLCCAA